MTPARNLSEASWRQGSRSWRSKGRLSCRSQGEWTVMSSISRGGNVGCRVLALTPPTSLSDTVKPEAWLATGPHPGPGRLLLVCHVSGFHPKPVWVMWMRGEQEQQGTQRDNVLPHADGTWYLRVTLDVEAWEAASLSCRVRHSSLGGQDIVLHWEGSHSSTWLIPVAILGSLLMSGCVGCLVLWCRKHGPLSSYQGIL
ncbi:antigen-presenting glycoprotein CD1d-like isoform X3 [Lutra lutra]|uniref:antigen-presenting glycoprotein CD1d-like isoform X3 n=1 Tax=Lutra lutra TaxID=9657 RepID=UPI001FD3B0DE|nr:antigen-presenting glycoprotein CD1d-like isoform X3 [Lutra lutra]